MKRKGTDTSFKLKCFQVRRSIFFIFFATCFLSLAKSVISISTSEPHYYPSLPAQPHQNLHAGNLVCVSMRPRSSFAFRFLLFPSFLALLFCVSPHSVRRPKISFMQPTPTSHISKCPKYWELSHYQLSQSRAACRFSADELYMCPNLRREWGLWLTVAPLSFFLGYRVISVFPGVKFYLSSESLPGSTSGRWSLLTCPSSAQMSSIKQHIRARCCLLQPVRSSACIQQHASASGYWQARRVEGVQTQHSRTLCEVAC